VARHQGLQFDHERPVSLHGREHGRTRHIGCPIGEEQPARVLDRPHAVGRHLEQAQFIGRPEPVLRHAQQPEGMVPVTRQLDNGVDDVLQHLGSCKGAVLGDVPDQHGGGATSTCLADQPVGTGPYLGRGSRNPGDRRVVDGLDGIDHQQVGPHPVEVGDHHVEVGVAGQPHPVDECGQPLGPQPDLGRRLLGPDQQDATLPTCQAGGDLQGQGGLAYTRLAPQQGHRPRDETSTHGPVELRKARGHRCGGSRRHLGEQDCLGLRRHGARLHPDHLVQRVPPPASRTVADPPGLRHPALGATEVGAPTPVGRSKGGRPRLRGEWLFGMRWSGGRHGADTTDAL